jgi:hypothetical protein
MGGMPRSCAQYPVEPIDGHRCSSILDLKTMILFSIVVAVQFGSSAKDGRHPSGSVLLADELVRVMVIAIELVTGR